MRGFEVSQHALREYAHLSEDHGHFRKHVIDEDGGIGKNDAFDGAVRNVTLVPECDVFECGEHVGAHEAREAADLFARNRVALVGHGGTAALLAAERLFTSRTSVRWRWRISSAILSSVAAMSAR